jgi:fatty-acyl-CoA synthase
MPGLRAYYQMMHGFALSESCFDWADRHSSGRRDDVAVANADSPFTLTWAQLEARVARLARLLADVGRVRHGDRIALLAENDARYFEVQFACVRLGAVFVPLNVRLSPAELRATVDDADPVLLIHDSGLAALAASVAGPGGRALPLLRWDDDPRGTRYAQVGDAAAGTVRAGRAAPDDVAQILYTSGTTGKPKGVMTTNRALAANAVNMAHSSRVADRDAHALNFVPLYHAGGLNIYCNPVLYWGGRVTTTRGFDEAQALRLLTDGALGVTITNGVLQMFERIAALDEFAAARFPSLRVTLFGGFGPTAPQTYRRWFGRGFALQLGYGSTELGPMASMNEAPDAEAIARGEFGRVLPLTEVRCLDADGTPLPPGQTGEIQVRGPAVTAGYWQQGKDGRTDDGWFSIGDVGFLDEARFVHITGRIVERYRSGGENIYPAEVEAAFLDLPGIVELAVIGVPDPAWGEVGLLVVVTEPGAEITLDTVRRHADGRLSRFKIPRHLRVVDRLPRSTTEKVARRQLRALFTDTEPGYVEP